MAREQTTAQPAPLLPENPNWLCLGALGALVLMLLGKTLFTGSDEVLSDWRLDLGRYFVYWRYFDFFMN